MYLIQKNSQTELNDFNPFKTKDQTDTNAYKATRAQLLTVDYIFRYFYNPNCYTYLSTTIFTDSQTSCLPNDDDVATVHRWVPYDGDADDYRSASLDRFVAADLSKPFEETVANRLNPSLGKVSPIWMWRRGSGNGLTTTMWRVTRRGRKEFTWT